MQDQSSNIPAIAKVKYRVIDIQLGDRFGKWLVIGEAARLSGGARRLVCQCDCGTIKALRAQTLVIGDSTSCRCLSYKVAIGQRFGRLLVVATAPQDSLRGRRFVVECDCGNTKTLHAGALTRTSEPYRSCGCLAKDINRQRWTKHGMSFDPHYKIWSSMIARCTNPKDDGYQWYGGRGITVCDSWRWSFESFYQDMGPRPSGRHTLERKDGNKGYNPDNCIWATFAAQARNTRRNHILEYDGISLCLTDWAAKMGLSPNTLTYRLAKGWSVEDALTTKPGTFIGRKGGPAKRPMAA